MKERLLAAIGRDLSEEEFAALACEVSLLQRGALPLLDRAGSILPIRGDRPWKRIPILPARVFKESRVACFSPREEVAAFRSSGTTGGPGVRPVRDLDLYSASVRAGFARTFPDAPARRVALLPSPEEAQNSSLARMAEFLDCAFAEVPPEGSEPVLLFGTALGFAKLLSQGSIRPLAPGSLILETGGYKGARTEWNREELHERLRETSGVMVRSEYGMSETFSQGYTSGVEPIYRFPPWCRVRVIDPFTLDDAASGETGLVALYDLANLDTTVGILTEDFGRRAGEENAFEYLGRATGAEARGCSLALESLR